MSEPTDDEERSEIENARRCIAMGLHWNTASARTIVALADENDRLRAERDGLAKVIEIMIADAQRWTRIEKIAEDLLKMRAP